MVIYDNNEGTTDMRAQMTDSPGQANGQVQAPCLK